VAGGVDGREGGGKVQRERERDGGVETLSARIGREGQRDGVKVDRISAVGLRVTCPERRFAGEWAEERRIAVPIAVAVFHVDAQQV
jgi:hypothetical protein